MFATVWADRPDLRPWCATLIERAARWRPDPTLGIDVCLIVDAVARAAAAAAPWLVHPCMNALTCPTVDCRSERDVRFITWVAAHTQAAVGAFTLEHPSWRWSVVGRAVPVPAGRHDLASLVAGDASTAHPIRNPIIDTICDPIIDGIIDPIDPVVVPAIAIDPFCRSTGLPLPLSWIEPLTPAEASLVDMAVREIGHALALRAHAACLCQVGGCGHSRDGSAAARRDHVVLGLAARGPRPHPRIRTTRTCRGVGGARARIGASPFHNA